MKMKLYLCLCISLALINRSSPKNIELLNTESTSNSSQNTTTQNIKSTPNLSQSTLNSTENVVTLSTESTLNPTEKSETQIFENTPTTIRTEPKCPENMISSPWRPMATTLKCYCEYPFLPLPVNNTCFELFMQGPCETGNFIVQPLRVKGILPLPRCAPNPCLEDGLVPYNGTCHNILTDPLCEYGNLYFREATSDLKCLLLIRLRTVIEIPFRRQCLVGSRADRNGKCRRRL